MSYTPRSRRLSLLSFAAVLALGVVACDDPYEVRARLGTVEDTLVVNAISDTAASATAPVAVNLAGRAINSDTPRSPATRRLTAAFDFDFAVDVEGDEAVILPPRLVATSVFGVRRVGLREDSTSDFEAIRSAPATGYQFDTVAVRLRVGETAIIVAQNPVCNPQAGEVYSELYAKIGLLAIDPVAKTATLRIRLDPNCGFRSFLPGVPGS